MTTMYVLGALLLAGLVSAGPTSEKCNPTYLDECGRELVLFSQRPSIPADPESLQQQCQREKESEKCTRDFVENCMESLTKGIGIIVLDEIKKELYTRCDPNHNNNKRYFQHADCLNTAGEGIHTCVNTLVDSMNAIAKANPRHQIGLACCNFGDFRECVDTAVRGKCEAPTVKYLSDVLDAYAGELLGLVCTAHKPGSPACRKLPALPELPAGETRGSLFGPLTKVAESLG